LFLPSDSVLVSCWPVPEDITGGSSVEMGILPAEPNWMVGCVLGNDETVHSKKRTSWER